MVRLVLHVKARGYAIIRALMKPIVQDIVDNDSRVFGPRERVSISPEAQMMNTLFNTVSGRIEIGEFTFAGHNVCLLTGTHDYTRTSLARMNSAPKHYRDIVIGRGVWLGSNSVVLGPCRIGDNAVVAAGSLVNSNVPAGVVVAGTPARIVKRLESSESGPASAEGEVSE